MKDASDGMSIDFGPSQPPAIRLLAFAMALRDAMPARGNVEVTIPRAVRDAMDVATFQEVFTDLLLDLDPEIGKRLRIVVAPVHDFRLRRISA